MRVTIVVSDGIAVLDGAVVLRLGELAYETSLPLFDEDGKHTGTVDEKPVLDKDGKQLRINSLPLKIDFSSLAQKGITAVQWYDTWGEVEYETIYLSEEKRWDRKPNEHIDNFSAYQKIIDAAIAAEKIRADKAEQVREKIVATALAKQIADYEALVAAELQKRVNQ